MFAWIPSQICVDSESYLDRCTLGDAPAGQLGRPGPAPGFAPGALVAAGIPAGGAPRRRSSHRVLRLGSARSWPVPAGPEARGQARPGPIDSEDSDGLCWPGAVSGGRPDPVRVTRMVQRAGEAPNKGITSHTKMYLANRPSIRDTPAPSMPRHPQPGPGSCPAAGRRGKGLHSLQGRRSPETACAMQRLQR